MPAPPRGPLPLSPAAIRGLLAFVAVHGALFALSEYAIAEASKPGWLLRYDAIAFLLLHVASATALLSAAARADLPAETRRGLRLLAAAFGPLIAGSLVSFAMHLLGRPLAYISWADLIYFQYYPLLVLGLHALPAVDVPRDRARDLLGWIVVSVAFGSLIIVAANLEAAQREISLFSRAMTVASSAAQLVTLIAINRALERARRLPSGRAMLAILVALAASTMGDLVAQILYSAGYEGVNFSRVLAIGTNVAMVWASLRFLTEPIPSDPELTSPRNPVSPLPIIAVSALALVLVWMSRRGLVEGTGVLFLGLVLLNLLLVARDMLSTRAASRAMQAITRREAARRLEALVRYSSDGILLLDADGHLLFASEPAERILGAPLSALVGRRIDQQAPEEERAMWRTFLAELGARPGVPATTNWQSRRPDGSMRLIEAVGLDLRQQPGVRGFVVNARDITERATLEERLRHAQKLEVVGRLAGGVAHDFNNVLTAIIAGVELAQLSLGPGNAAEGELVGVQAAAQRGAALTRRLLTFVRQEPVKAQRIALDEVLGELAPLMQRLAGETHEVTVRVDPLVGDVRADRAELEHILFNLVANARDAMAMGGPISVVADVEEVRGEVPFAVLTPPPGRYARIAVSDRGHGMPEEVRARMFDPFFTQKSGGRGTGLGLIGVRPLVEGAKGGVVVESSADGTRVALYLPLEATVAERATRMATPVTTARPVTPPPMRRVSPVRMMAARDAVRLLLVEDEPEIREQLARLLDTQGYHATAVASVADARAVLGADPAIAGIISDVMMPGETGLQFAEWLRAEHPRLPLLLISGHTGADLDREARANAAIEILRKPFSGAELAACVAAMLARRT